MALPVHVAALARARIKAHPNRDSSGKLLPGHQLRRRIPQQQHPHAIEADYAREIVKVLEVGRRALAPLLQALPDILSRAAAARGDAAELERRTVVGLDIVIENPAGSTRHWTDSDGTEGSTLMRWDYGYIDGVIGADGEDVDVYLGPDPDSTVVFVIHQNDKASGFTKYDEDKVMLGWSSAELAIRAYLEQYDDPRFFRGMSRFSITEFRERLRVADGESLSRAGGWRADAADTQLRALLERARGAMQRALDTPTLERLARRYGDQTSTFQKAQFARQTRAAFGVDVVTLDKKVPAMIEHFVGENAALIRSLGDKSVSDIEKLTTRALTTGQSADDVGDEIAERFDIHERHGRLIARDQVGRLTGQVNAARQRELGVASFRWDAVMDERTRPEHEELNGREFTYDDPPSDGLPGEPILCRCSATPIFDGLLDDADIDSSDADEKDADDES